MQGDEQSVHVVDRQRVQQHVGGGEAPGVGQRLAVLAQRRVAQHRAFGSAGGAARVDERGQVLRRGPVHRLKRRKRGRLGGQGHRVGDEQRRFGVGDEVVDLGLGVGGVQRQEHGADRQRRQVQHHRLRALRCLHGDAIAGRDALGLEQRRETAGAGFHLAVCDGLAVQRLQEGLGPVGRKARGEQGVEVAVHVLRLTGGSGRLSTSRPRARWVQVEPT